MLLPVLLIVYLALLFTGVVYMILNTDTMFKPDTLLYSLWLVAGYGAVMLALMLWIFRLWGDEK